MINYYAKTDKDNFVTKFFSDSFSHPTDDDILYLSDQDNRHCRLPTQDDAGAPLYCVYNGEIIDTTESERLPWHVDRKIAEIERVGNNAITNGLTLDEPAGYNIRLDAQTMIYLSEIKADIASGKYSDGAVHQFWSGRQDVMLLSNSQITEIAELAKLHIMNIEGQMKVAQMEVELLTTIDDVKNYTFEVEK
jgi:hypothetical protein